MLAEARDDERTRRGVVSAVAPSGGRHRWLLLGGVLLLGLTMQLLPLFILDRRERLLPRLVSVGLEMPMLVVALSLGHEWARRRAFGTLPSLLVSLGLTLIVGATSALLAYDIILTHFGSDALPGPPDRPVSRPGMMAFGVVSGMFTAGLWAFAFVYPSAIEESRLGAIEAERLKLEAESLRTAAELTRLRSQLEPHFLLNTLNAIAGLVTQEPREARRLLALLGTLLSDTLQAGQEPTLERELSWLRGYASILESRFKGALEFEWSVDEGFGAVLVPHLFLQPLLENAVTHGALARRTSGEARCPARVGIRIAGSESSGARMLTCTVDDDGPGFDPGSARSGGIGIASARRRLALWSPDASLRFESSARGTRAIVVLPERGTLNAAGGALS